MKTEQSEYIGREVALMTAYETIMVLLELLALLVCSGGLMIALLSGYDDAYKQTSEYLDWFVKNKISKGKNIWHHLFE